VASPAAAAPFSADGNGLRVLSGVDGGGRVRDDPARADHGRARGQRPGGEPECRHHRQPERQNDAKGGPRGYDAAKKVKGRKRHIAVDSLGLLLAVAVHPANVQDRDGAALVLARLKPLYCWLRVMFADSAYNSVLLMAFCFTLGITLMIVNRVLGTVGFQVLAKRWIVERSLGWLGRWRRLSKDDEELPEVSEAFVTLAMIKLMLRRLTAQRTRLSAAQPPPALTRL
jgi:transposase